MRIQVPATIRHEALSRTSFVYSEFWCVPDLHFARDVSKQSTINFAILLPLHLLARSVTDVVLDKHSPTAPPPDPQCLVKAWETWQTTSVRKNPSLHAPPGARVLSFPAFKQTCGALPCRRRAWCCRTSWTGSSSCELAYLSYYRSDRLARFGRWRAWLTKTQRHLRRGRGSQLRLSQETRLLAPRPQHLVPLRPRIHQCDDARDCWPHCAWDNHRAGRAAARSGPSLQSALESISGDQAEALGARKGASWAGTGNRDCFLH